LLVRFVRDSRGILAVDGGAAAGRGAYLHPFRACLEAALRGGGFFRAMRGKIALAPQGQQQPKPAKNIADESTMERLWAQLETAHASNGGSRKVVGVSDGA